MFDLYEFLRLFGKNFHYAFLIMAFCFFVLVIVCFGMGRTAQAVENLIFTALNCFIFLLFDRTEI